MSLQLEAISKEEQRLNYKREVLQKVNERNSNPGRSMIDPGALDAQVNEKRQKAIMAREADKRERAKIDEVERILEEAALEEKRMKAVMSQQMREDWMNRQSVSTGRKTRVIDPVVPENCGASACQAFIGEDSNCKDRQRLQKAQMRRWIEEQIREKDEKKRKEKEEDDKYFQYIKFLDGALGDSSQEEAEAHRRQQIELARANKELADEIAKKKADEREQELNMNEDEISATMSLSFMLEDVGSALADGNGKVARVDHFKGFTTEQKQKIYKDNIAQVAKQREEERMEKERQAQMEAQAIQAARAREKALVSQQMKLETERKQLMAQQMKAQMEEQASKRAASKADRFGSIDAAEGSLFSKFKE